MVCFRSFFGHKLNQYSTPLKFEVNSNKWGLTVDWLRNQIYFYENRRVVAYDMSIETTTHLYTTDSDCNDLAVDPFTR